MHNERVKQQARWEYLVFNVLNENARDLLESSAQILVSIKSNPGDLTNREIDTSKKKTQTVKILKISIK